MFTRLLPLILGCAAAFGQTLEFEAASVKPAMPLGPMGMVSDQKGGPGTTDPGLFTCRNCSLYWVLADAWPIHGYDFAGPDWLQSTRFDFSAKVPAGATKEDFQKMLRNLFVERFKLAIHTEKRPMQVYELTAGKSGPKFKESTPKEPLKDDAGPPKFQRDADGFPILSPGSGMGLAPGHGRIQSQDERVAWFAQTLAGQLHAPVVDATGLTGKYDFVVSWAWDEGPDAASAFAAQLINAVQSQLGLKLERKKGDADVLVVDHIDKTPTEN
jgi:uncharacterized protein (TIGR03435 family)